VNRIPGKIQMSGCMSHACHTNRRGNLKASHEVTVSLDAPRIEKEIINEAHS